jgi:hypothetical protein
MMLKEQRYEHSTTIITIMNVVPTSLLSPLFSYTRSTNVTIIKVVLAAASTAFTAAAIVCVGTA